MFDRIAGVVEHAATDPQHTVEVVKLLKAGKRRAGTELLVERANPSEELCPNCEIGPSTPVVRKGAMARMDDVLHRLECRHPFPGGVVGSRHQRRENGSDLGVVMEDAQPSRQPVRCDDAVVIGEEKKVGGRGADPFVEGNRLSDRL